MMLGSFTLASATALFDPSFIYCLPGFVATYAYLFSLLKKLDLSNRAQCGEFFKRNNYIGVFIFLSLLLRGIFSEKKKTDAVY
jgi:4-hydroxybenzoate polyprenyltransferase